mmetsp:Transcript_28925/g.81465  ORF Transcript_28925/g.81465 Transcript_28925/m.81465 type:complete len:220 (-) Transcript_28925:674-1333(-)
MYSSIKENRQPHFPFPPFCFFPFPAAAPLPPPPAAEVVPLTRFFLDVCRRERASASKRPMALLRSSSTSSLFSRMILSTRLPVRLPSAASNRAGRCFLFPAVRSPGLSPRATLSNFPPEAVAVPATEDACLSSSFRCLRLVVRSLLGPDPRSDTSCRPAGSACFPVALRVLLWFSCSCFLFFTTRAFFSSFALLKGSLPISSSAVASITAMSLSSFALL